MYTSSQYQTIYEDRSRIGLYYRSQSFSANITHYQLEVAFYFDWLDLLMSIDVKVLWHVANLKLPFTLIG
jgi:hypothetical protein